MLMQGHPKSTGLEEIKCKTAAGKKTQSRRFDAERTGVYDKSFFQFWIERGIKKKGIWYCIK